MTITKSKKMHISDTLPNGRSYKSEGKLRCKSGISVKSDIGFALEKESSSYFPALQILLTCASVIAIIFMLQSFFVNNGYKYPLINIDTACLNIFMTALSAMMISRGKLFFKLVGGAYLLLNVLWILSNSDSAAMGFMYTANMYSKAAELPFRLFETQIAQYQPLDMGTFVITFAFLSTLLTSIGCIFYVNFPILFLVTFPIFELGAYHGWMPAIWTVVVMVICWVTTLSISLINHTARRSSKSNFAVSLKKKAFYLTSSEIKTKFFSTHALTVIVASTCAFTAALIFYAAKGNYRPESFKELRRNITKKFGEVTTDIANGNFSAPKVPGRSAMVGGLNGGQWLGSIGKIEFTGKTSLRVKYKPFSRSLYLRGYTGSSYERYPDGDSKWEFIRADIDAVKLFEEDNRLILDYNNIMLENNNEFAMAEHSVMTVSPVNSDPVTFYAPYGTDYSKCDVLADSDQYYDGMLSPSSQRQTYDVDICAPSDMMSWDAVLNEYDSLSKWELYPPIYQFYSDLVYNTEEYRSVPDYLDPMLKKIVSDAEIDTSADTLAMIKRKFNIYFAANGFTYSTDFGVTPADQDFIQYFLEGKNNNKKGCCRHYASAAVMLMRELGYPARYVEGFLIEPSQQSSGDEWMTITDRSLHAWCEVFIKGYGWYPIELTPGYSTSGNPNLTDKDKNIEKEESSSSEPDKNESKSSDSSSKSSDSKKDNDSSSKKAETPTSSSKAPKPVPVPGQKPGSGGGGTGNDGGSGGGGKVTYLVMMILFIVGFAAAIVVRRKHILNEIDKSIHSSSDSKSVISCYTALLKYISLLGIKNDTSLTDVQMSSKITTELSVKAPQLNNIFVEISEPAITAYMSGSEYGRDTADNSRKLLNSAKKMIFGKLGFFERLSAQWISGLY